LPKLLNNIRGYVAQGHTAVKIKLGKKDLEENLSRVAVGISLSLFLWLSSTSSSSHAVIVCV
jgi:hypothetical protein